MTKPKKTEHQILQERLAELSADIPAKVGKMAREHAVNVAKSLVREAKVKLAADFKLWLDKGLLSVVPKEMQTLYENYITLGKQVQDHLAMVSEASGISSYDRIGIGAPIKLEQFITGHRNPYGWQNDMHASLATWHTKIKGYDKKKAEFDARVTELDHMVKDVEAAVFRSYKNKAAVTQSGIDIAGAVSAAMKSALGTNLLAAPKTVEAEIVDDVA